MIGSWLPDFTVVLFAIGILPEALVRLQNVARKVVLAGRRVENG
jgi:hypothetical protein